MACRQNTHIWLWASACRMLSTKVYLGEEPVTLEWLLSGLQCVCPSSDITRTRRIHADADPASASGMVLRMRCCRTEQFRTVLNSRRIAISGATSGGLCLDYRINFGRRIFKSQNCHALKKCMTALTWERCRVRSVIWHYKHWYKYKIHCRWQSCRQQRNGINF